MQSFDTLSEAMNVLREQGFTYDFNLAFDQIICESKGLCLNPNQFEIMQVFRFEEMTNPSDSAILYAIESKDHGIKGMLVTPYGAYAEEVDTVMLEKLKMHH